MFIFAICTSVFHENFWAQFVKSCVAIPWVYRTVSVRHKMCCCWSECWFLTTGWAVQLDCSVWAELVNWKRWLKGCASVIVLLSFHFMMHVLFVFFFSFVRITTYSFLMLLKIPYEFMGMLWWLPCASQVCQFPGQDSCSFRLHHLQSLHMYFGEKSSL